MTGIVTGFEIGKNRNGTGDVVLLQVRISDQKDIQTVELMTPPGDDSIPPIDSRVVILQVSSSWKIAIANQDGISPQSGAGEKRLYSQSGGSEAAYVYLRDDGKIEINGNADFAVAFNDLKSGFDQLKSNFNTFVTTIFNLHTHISSAPASPTGPPVPTGSSSSASIDASKVEEVLLP